MTLTSPAFEPFGAIPRRYSCEGEGERPPLAVSGIPRGTRSLALIVDDLDAKDGNQNFLHWIAWNVAPDTALVDSRQALPGAVEGLTSFGTYHWGAPCPPRGAHRYRFRAFALNGDINLERDAGAEDLEEEMDGHVLGSAELIGTYQRRYP